MIFWAAVNVATALAVSWIGTYMLVRHPGVLSRMEELAIGVIAGCMVLRVAPILGKRVLDMPTPFDDWATSVMQIGVAVLFLGWMRRMERRRVL